MPLSPLCYSLYRTVTMPSENSTYDPSIYFLTTAISVPSPPLPDLAGGISYVATTNPDKSQSMMGLIEDILDELEQMGEEGEEMKRVFEDELGDRAVAGFVDYWNNDNNDPFDPDHPIDDSTQPHPLLLSTHLGDLYALGLIPSSIHEDCIAYLIENVASGEDLLALYMLISRSTGRNRSRKKFKAKPPKMDPLFLGQCFIAIRDVCERLQKDYERVEKGEGKGVWGDLENPRLLLRHIGELFQACDERLRFPDIPL